MATKTSTTVRQWEKLYRCLCGESCGKLTTRIKKGRKLNCKRGGYIKCFINGYQLTSSVQPVQITGEHRFVAAGFRAIRLFERSYHIVEYSHIVLNVAVIVG